MYVQEMARQSRSPQRRAPSQPADSSWVSFYDTPPEQPDVQDAVAVDAGNGDDGMLRRLFHHYASGSDLLEFRSLLQLFDDAVVFKSADGPGVIPLLRRIEPPAGAAIAWSDFTAILEMVAAFKLPDLPVDVAVTMLIEDLAHFETHLLGAPVGEQEEELAVADQVTAAAQPEVVISEAAAEDHTEPPSRTASTTATEKGVDATRYLPDGIGLLTSHLRLITREFDTSASICEVLRIPPTCSEAVSKLRADLLCVQHADEQRDQIAVWEFAAATGGLLFPLSMPTAAEELAYQWLLDLATRYS